MKKWIAAFGVLLVLTSAILANVIPVNADEDIKEITLDSGSLTIKGDDITEDDDYEYKYVDSEYGYILTIKSEKQMTISGNTTVDRIVVNSQNGANLIFSDLSVDASKRGDLAAFDIDASITNKDTVIKVTLENDTDNTLKSKLHAGLQKSSGDCTLIIEGDGKLAAIGGDNSAGIGGGNGGNGTNIIIKGGDITATGGTGGAGIGGGNGGSGSNIQIDGGTIVATTLSDGGAGIGGGNGGNGEKIYIYDCEKIIASGSSGGAGIGGGLNGDGDDIQIQKGKKITANGSGDSTGYGGGAGIGGGSNGSGTNITISGGDDIMAEGGPGSAGIGGGSDIYNSGSGNGSDITISGDAKVIATGGNGGAGIGGGGNGSGINITISGGSVEATSGGYGAGIGGGRGATGANIIISGGDNIIAKGGIDGAGIGGGYQGSGSGITISGGSVEATSVDGGAGIGGGSNGSGGAAIVITDGGETKSFSGITIKDSAKVIATGGYRGAGIGGGGYGAGTNITISGSADVTTKGYGGGAGIGGGYDGDGSDITISGGMVKASCESTDTNNSGYGAGIGGGANGGSGSNIEISGSTTEVEAFGCPYGSSESTGNRGGAGIGGGNNVTSDDKIIKTDGGKGSNITISGGSIKATGGGDGAGIGGGDGGDGNGIIISGGSIKATSFNGGAGIGGGNNMKANGTIIETDGGKGSNIEISGSAKVDAIGGYRGAGIGGGSGGNGSNITIGADSDSDDDITKRVVTAISKGATSGRGNGAGIGGGANGNGEDITINSGKVIAESDLGAGIGGGYVTSPSSVGKIGSDGINITINGGNIEATSNEGGAGIGGGQYGGCGKDIFINGGTVTAINKSTNDVGGAGIGGGSSYSSTIKGNGDNIVIMGGTITATGGGAGIGGGSGGDGTKITIGGKATVTATGATKAGFGGSAGIGGGNGGDGNDITINGSAKVTATSLADGADIGSGSSGLATNIKISGNADVTVDNQKCYVCIGSCKYSTEECLIEITGGTVRTTTENTTENTDVAAYIGIGSPVRADITISGDAKVEATSSYIGIGSYGLGYVTIDGAKEVTAIGKHAGINSGKITINGDKDTLVAAVCEHDTGAGIGSAQMSTDNPTVTITGGEIRATNKGGGTGIGGTESTDNTEGIAVAVYIEGTSSTSYPWVFTNKITSTNDDGDYFGIVFDENHKNTYKEADKPVAGEESCNSNPEVYKADGVVYGKGQDVVLNKEYTLESGKVLRVQGSAKFKIPEAGEGKDNMLTLEAGSILYIEKGADLDKYDKITYEGEGDNKGKVLHEAKSVYEDVTAEAGKTKKLCTLCGSETNHTWKTDWVYSKIHHWHDCEDDTDCSIHEYKINLCSITENEDKDGYGEHSFVKTRSNNIVTFTCSACGYSYNVKIPEISIYKVGSDDEGEHSLPGAKFRLYSNADCTEQVGEEVTAAERTVNGETKAVAVFTTDIVLDTLYYIKETEAPDGYIKSNKVYTVKVTAETDELDESDDLIELPYEPQTIDGKAAYGVLNSEGNVTELNGIPTYVNTRKITPDPIKIIKEDGETNSPLAGAQFRVYSDAACQNPIAGMTGTTAIDADNASDTYNKAVVSFDTEPDTIYYIKETKAPDGYRVSHEVFKAVVDADGKVTYGVVGSTATSEEIPVCENYAVEVVSDPVKIIKVDGETNSPLAGAQFSVFSDEACQNPIAGMTRTTAIDADNASDTYNKAVVSFSTEPDTTYYIKETKAPDGYTASDKVYRAVVGADGKVTYGVVGSTATYEEIPVCENYAVEVVSAPVKIIKVDGETRAPLAGAQFSVFSDEACQNPIAGMTGTTAMDSDNASATYNKAVVSFSTEPDTTYYIKEITPPDGYTASDKVFKAVVGADGKVTYSIVGSETTLAGIPVCENYAVKVIVSDPARIIKVDGETGAPLAGAQFGIYSDAERTKLIKTVTAEIDTDNASATYNKAVVSFSTEPDSTYYIKETFAPDGYRVSDEVFMAVVDADGKVTYGAVGSETTSADIPICKNYAVKIIVSAPAKIIKVDSETGTPLTGAQFGIYSDAECTKLITTGTTEIDTNNASATYNKAVISFSTEPNRTYFIKETNAPDGYRVSHEVFKAVVDADGKVTYGVAGSATTSETVPVCKNEKTDEDDDISDLEPDPEDTPPAKAVSPKTGDTVGSGIVGIAILSGIVCAASLVGGVQKRKKKQ